MDCCLFKSCLAKSPNFSRHRSGVDFVDPAFCNRFFGGFRSSKLAFSSGFLGLSLDEGIGNYGSRVPHRGSVNVIIPFASAGLNERVSDALATPLVMQSSPGKFLNEVLQNQPHLFAATAAEQLERLAEERNGAVVRKRNSAGTDECLLHSRIAELKGQECNVAVEEVMYMLVAEKFADINVHMVPRLNRCIRNGRLLTWSSKDHELETIHECEILEMVDDHLCRVLGQRGEAAVTDNWTATRIRRLRLGRVYAASILYGYFLKSAWRRHHLENNLMQVHDFPFTCTIRLPPSGFWPGTSDDVVIATAATERLEPHSTCGSPSAHQQTGCIYKETFKKYVISFDMESLQRCATLRSKEAVNLVEKHSWALFGKSENGGVDGIFEEDEVLTVPFTSLRRLLLEAIAFGSFLWDVESYVGSAYDLQENIG